MCDMSARLQRAEENAYHQHAKNQGLIESMARLLQINHDLTRTLLALRPSDSGLQRDGKNPGSSQRSHFPAADNVPSPGHAERASEASRGRSRARRCWPGSRVRPPPALCGRRRQRPRVAQADASPGRIKTIKPGYDAAKVAEFLSPYNSVQPDRFRSPTLRVYWFRGRPAVLPVAKRGAAATIGGSPPSVQRRHALHEHGQATYIGRYSRPWLAGRRTVGSASVVAGPHRARRSAH